MTALPGGTPCILEALATILLYYNITYMTGKRTVASAGDDVIARDLPWGNSMTDTGAAVFPPRIARAGLPAMILLACLFGPAERGYAAAVGTVDGIAKDALERPLEGTQLRLETA